MAIPGPSVVPDRVLQSMHRASPNIYSGEIVGLVEGILEDLKRVAGTAFPLNHLHFQRPRCLGVLAFQYTQPGRPHSGSGDRACSPRGGADLRRVSVRRSSILTSACDPESTSRPCMTA